MGCPTRKAKHTGSSCRSQRVQEGAALTLQFSADRGKEGRAQLPPAPDYKDRTTNCTQVSSTCRIGCHHMGNGHITYYAREEAAGLTRACCLE